MADAVRARGLVKTYGRPSTRGRGGGVTTALDGVDLDVPEGTVLGLLGPNGAGKTTTVRILTTLLVPDAGEAQVAGVDVLRDPQEVRRRIGVSGQYAAVDEYLTGFENLRMVGELYHQGSRRASARARELLELFSLSEAADRPVKGYSGGMRRRLDLAGALVNDPPVLFLDEPTTGLDPRSRADMWELLQGMVRGGTTVVLTTQYLEEADLLADDIIVIDHGRAIARGTSDQLKAQVGGERVELVVDDAAHLDEVRSLLGRVAVGEVEVEPHTRRLTAPVEGGAAVLVRLLAQLEERGVHLSDAGTRRPTMDDVFLTLTGKRTDGPAGADDEKDGAAS